MMPAMRPILVALCFLPLAAGANPTGGTVTSGSATISSSGSTLTVNTSTTGTVINWGSFSIAAGETTRINQPSSGSATLNRVTGVGQSSINGSLQSNGQVFLVNPNGIVFGSTASVNVAGFVGSTLDITDADFLSGNYRFTASGSPGPIANTGVLTGTDYVALIAPTIQNDGSISAGAGGIALVSGTPATLALANGVIGNATVGASFPGGSIEVQGPLSTPGNVFVVSAGASFSGDAVCTLGGGGLCGGSIVPPLPVVVASPGTLTINQNPGTSSGVISWTNFNIGTGSSVAIAKPGTVEIQGALTAAGSAPAVTTTGVSLSLEKREFSF